MIALLLATAAFAAEDITVPTADGVELHATVHGAAGATRGVVLVHMEGRHGGDWNFMAERLGRSGMRTVAPDLRGHGTSPVPPAFNGEDFAPMVADVEAAVGWLRAQGVTDISCTGAGVGANLCMRVAAADPQISNVVLLSPGLKIKGVAALDVIETYGSRPLLVVASIEDRYAAISADKIDARAKGEKRLEMLNKAGHGTKMLTRDTSLESTVVEWLLAEYSVAQSGPAASKAAVGSEVEKVKTTGKTLDSRER